MFPSNWAPDLVYYLFELIMYQRCILLILCILIACNCIVQRITCNNVDLYIYYIITDYISYITHYTTHTIYHNCHVRIKT